MKKLLVLIVLILVATVSKAEEKRLLFNAGFYGSYMYNIHLPDFYKLPLVPSCCPHYINSGYGSGYSFGTLFDFNLSNSFKLGFRLGMSSLNGELSEEEIIGNYSVKDPQGRQFLTDVTVDHLIDASLYDINFEPYISYYPTEKFLISAGIKTSYLFSGNYSQEERLLSPGNVTFIDGKVTRNDDIKNEPLPDKQELLFFGSLGTGYRFEIARNTYVTPEVKLFVPFSDISSVTWKIMSLSFGANLSLPIYASPKVNTIKETIYLRDTTTILVMGLEESTIKLLSTDDSEAYKITNKDTVLYRYIIKEKYELSAPRDAELSTSLAATGITKDGQKKENPEIIIEETEESELFPLLPQIFFIEGNSAIDTSQQTLLTKLGTEVFNEDLLKWNTLNIYSNLLNIIGSRLKNNPAAEITVTGCNSGNGIEKNNTNLSKKRAETVKSYLTDIWKINPKRIKVQSRNLPEAPSNKTQIDGQQENQRVEITSASPDILSPVTLRQISRTSNPPIVEIVPTIKSEAELKSWRITVNQAGNPLREFNGGIIPDVLKWNVEEKPIPVVEAPVDIQLTAINKYMQKSVANKSLVIQQKTIKKKREEIRNDLIIERFSLIVFDFDKAQLTKNQVPIMEKIKERIKPNSKVIIAGYTDRTGEHDYNKDLALRRCQEVQKYLNIPEQFLTINPVGSDELLYNNDLPQGRSYSRTVKITIETPVK